MGVELAAHKQEVALADTAAGRLAAEVGITDVRAGLLPQDKVAAVQGQEAAGRRVLVIGDGVNDAPALAAAHVGIAMGAGSDLALETAGAVIVRDELATVPTVVALSRRARGLVVQNLVIASVFITALVVWDLTGSLPLPLGVLGTRAPPSSSASTAYACSAKPPGTEPPSPPRAPVPRAPAPADPPPPTRPPLPPPCRVSGPSAQRSVPRRPGHLAAKEGDPTAT